MRVLVVESDPEVARLLADLLRDEGHENMLVPDRAAALAALGDQSFDVCICDGFGPSVTDLEHLDHDELVRLSATVPVVLCTAHTWAADLGAEQLGVAAVVRKPFDLGDLIAVVERTARP